MAASFEPFLYASSVPGISKTEPHEPRPIVRNVSSSAEDSGAVGPCLERVEIMGLADNVLRSRCQGSSSLERSFPLVGVAELGADIVPVKLMERGEKK